jgi:hypothetical protein
MHLFSQNSWLFNGIISRSRTPNFTQIGRQIRQGRVEKLTYILNYLMFCWPCISVSVSRNQRDAIFIQRIKNFGPLHVSSITCSSSGGAWQAALGILSACYISWLQSHSNPSVYYVATWGRHKVFFFYKMYLQEI